MNSGLSFGERLKTIIVLMGMTQRTFASLAHLNESQLSKLLRSKRIPTFRELSNILNVLNIPYDCLVGNVPFFDELLMTVATSKGIHPIW